MPAIPIKKQKNTVARVDVKYPQLVEFLTAQIREGKLSPGDRLPTFVQLQNQFGVTPPTVNRAMVDLEHKGLIERRPGMGTFILDQNKTRTRGVIGLLGYGFSGGRSSYWMSLLEGIHNTAQATRSEILLMRDALRGHVGEGWEKLDGALLSDCVCAQDQKKIPSKFPIVCLFAQQASWSSVLADEYSGIRLAVEHLLTLGHKRVAYLHGDNQQVVSRRLQGYNDALRAAGIMPQPNWLRSQSGQIDFGSQFNAAGRSEMTKWIADTSPSGWKAINCTALLCHNDETAIGAMKALNEAGLKVPDDVSVIGFDGIDVCEYSSPQLTSVEMPLQRMGEVAMELLQRQIDADEVFSEHKLMPTQLRIRESTSAPRL